MRTGFKLLVLGLLVVGGWICTPNAAAAAGGCYCQSKLYPEGATACMGGIPTRCVNGGWSTLDGRCSTDRCPW